MAGKYVTFVFDDGCDITLNLGCIDVSVLGDGGDITLNLVCIVVFVLGDGCDITLNLVCVDVFEVFLNIYFSYDCNWRAFVCP